MKCSVLGTFVLQLLRALQQEKIKVSPHRSPGILSHLGPQVDGLCDFFDAIQNNM